MRKNRIGLMFTGLLFALALLWFVSSNDSDKILEADKDVILFGNGCNERFYESEQYFIVIYVEYDLRNVNEGVPNLNINIVSDKGVSREFELSLYGTRRRKNEFFMKQWVVYKPVLFDREGIYNVCVKGARLQLYETSKIYRVRNVGDWGGGVVN